MVVQILAASSRINSDSGLSIIVGLQDSILTYLHNDSSTFALGHQLRRDMVSLKLVLVQPSLNGMI